MRKPPFENTVGKGENAVNQQFSPPNNVFYPDQGNSHIYYVSLQIISLSTWDLSNLLFCFVKS